MEHKIVLYIATGNKSHMLLCINKDNGIGDGKKTKAKENNCLSASGCGC